MTSEEDRPDSGRPWFWRRSLSFLVTALGLFAHINPLFLPADNAGAATNSPPSGLPGHPERLAGHVPLSAVEVLLWRDLGFVAAAPPREA
jgi:hypothetical protein